ncbi:hypothetical protein PF002_g28751 [Phytophthora fragariae]|uniref:Uncharacterized protein n=1 Tax=Phytophthora fragariae TaxID=53985 RepID=A0A6A3W988_9STRA|nr:hypothetical protein PF002_g28751 [Phytophthora fragariae]
MEWEMHRQPVHQQEEELVDHERQCADGGCKLEKESKTEESTPPYYGTMSPEENNSNLPEDNVEQQAAEGDFDGAGDEKMREVSVEGENVNTQSEAGSSKDEGDEVAFSRAERGRSPTRILRNRGSRGGSRFDAPKQDGHRDGFATGPARTRKSVSPKRTAPAEWEQEGNDQSEGSRKKVKQDGKRSGVTRSLSPRKMGQLSPKKRDKKSHQQYMHQYLLETFQATASKHRRLGGSPVFSSTGDTVENLEARKQAYQVVKEAADGEDTEGHLKETEDSDCVYAGTKPGSDAGEALETWIGILGGTVTDVAANGQCGWLAGYAALYNHGEGVLLPTSETAETANLFKKEVLNGMIASIVDEVGENPENLEVELEASSISMPPGETHDSRVCALANHYVRQRTKSVQALVSAHLKGMSIHARETIYVLDVNPDGIARV